MRPARRPLQRRSLRKPRHPGKHKSLCRRSQQQPLARQNGHGPRRPNLQTLKPSRQRLKLRRRHLIRPASLLFTSSQFRHLQRPLANASMKPRLQGLKNSKVCGCRSLPVRSGFLEDHGIAASNPTISSACPPGDTISSSSSAPSIPRVTTVRCGGSIASSI